MNTAKPAPTVDRPCPKCDSSRVHRSHRRSALERLLSLAGAEIRRCHDCRMRQAWFGRIPLALGAAGSQSGPAAQLLVGAGALMLCLMFVWWVMQRFAADAG